MNKGGDGDQVDDREVETKRAFMEEGVFGVLYTLNQEQEIKWKGAVQALVISTYWQALAQVKKE